MQFLPGAANHVNFYESNMLQTQEEILASLSCKESKLLPLGFPGKGLSAQAKAGLNSWSQALQGPLSNQRHNSSLSADLILVTQEFLICVKTTISASQH